MRGGFVTGVAALLLVAACGESGGSATPTSSTVYIEVGDATTGTFYLSSDNLDPSTWKDDANSHKVAGLPNGSVTVCKFTLSQGVDFTVWSTGSQESTDLARAYCQRNGQ